MKKVKRVIMSAIALIALLASESLCFESIVKPDFPVMEEALR